LVEDNIVFEGSSKTMFRLKFVIKGGEKGLGLWQYERKFWFLVWQRRSPMLQLMEEKKEKKTYWCIQH